jgi:hypothetical protein
VSYTGWTVICSITRPILVRFHSNLALFAPNKFRVTDATSICILKTSVEIASKSNKITSYTRGDHLGLKWVRYACATAKSSRKGYVLDRKQVTRVTRLGYRNSSKKAKRGAFFNRGLEKGTFLKILDTNA